MNRRDFIRAAAGALVLPTLLRERAGPSIADVMRRRQEDIYRGFDLSAPTRWTNVCRTHEDFSKEIVPQFKHIDGFMPELTPEQVKVLCFGSYHGVPIVGVTGLT